jgi:AraC-like DNA-binding protein
MKQFWAATGQTPHRYLLELRLEKAGVLIASGCRWSISPQSVGSSFTLTSRCRFDLRDVIE